MSPKSIIIILLAMSGSFATIIAVLGYALGPDAGAGSRNRRTRTANVVSVAPPSPVLLSHPQVAGFDIPDGPVPLSPTPALLPPFPKTPPTSHSSHASPDAGFGVWNKPFHAR